MKFNQNFLNISVEMMIEKVTIEKKIFSDKFI